MKFTKEKANHFVKAGVSMWVYSTKEDCEAGSVVYQEVNGGHYEEFVNAKSAFIYYIIEGEGSFFIEDEEFKVKATDVIIVPAGKRFYYLGNMKQVLVTAPAWEESSETIIRSVEH